MTETIKFLQQKLFWVQKLHLLNSTFLSDLKKEDCKNNIPIADKFFLYQENRNSIYNIIQSINQGISKTAKKPGVNIQRQTDREKTKINYYLREIELITEDIINQDFSISKNIEDEYSNLKQELTLIKKGKKLISSYKSNQDTDKMLDKRV